MKRSHSKLLQEDSACSGETKKDRAAALLSCSTSTMTAFLRPELLLQILSFLPTRDVVRISSVSKDFQSLVESHDAILFEKRLETDFSEGAILARSMKEYYQERNQESAPTKICKAPFKKMYLAFFNREILSEVPKPEANTVTIPQDARSPNNQRLVRGNDEKALVFIGRVFDHPDSCCLLKWETDDHIDEDVDRLVSSTALKFPPLAPSLRRFVTDLAANPNARLLWGNGVPGGDEDYLPYMYTMTLHAIDLERFRVITLMEKNLPKMAGHDIDEGRFSFHGWSQSSARYLIAPSCEEIGNGSNDTIEINIFREMAKTNDELRKRNNICRFLRSAMKGKCVD